MVIFSLDENLDWILAGHTSKSGTIQLTNVVTPWIVLRTEQSLFVQIPDRTIYSAQRIAHVEYLVADRMFILCLWLIMVGPFIGISLVRFVGPSYRVIV